MASLSHSSSPLPFCTATADSDSAITPSTEAAIMDRNNITHDNQRDSPLLRLPAELRNKIYHFTFLASTVKVEMARSTPAKVPGQLQKSLSLFLTCRQTKSECAGMLCSLATFDMTRIRPAAIFGIDSAWATSVTTIMISRFSGKDIENWAQKLPSLRRVVVGEWYERALTFHSIQTFSQQCLISANCATFGLEVVFTE